MLEAFQAAFGTPAPYVVTIPATDERDVAHTLSFSPAALIDVGPNLVALVSTGEGKDTGWDCHACAGAMTVHYLKRDQGGFSLLGHWNIDAGSAPYGTAATWTIRTDLDDVPTMLLSNRNSGMGYEYEGYTLVAITPTGPENRGSFTLTESCWDVYGLKSTGDRPAETFTGKVVPLERGKSFAVDYTGTKTERVIYEKGFEHTFAPADVNQSDFPPNC